jgi:hypothetical protein
VPANFVPQVLRGHLQPAASAAGLAGGRCSQGGIQGHIRSPMTVQAVAGVFAAFAAGHRFQASSGGGPCIQLAAPIQLQNPGGIEPGSGDFIDDLSAVA